MAMIGPSASTTAMAANMRRASKEVLRSQCQPVSACAGRPGHHAAGRVSDQRGGENAVIARIAAVKQRDQNRHVADQPNTPPQQMAAERAGRHKRADRQHQRAQGELHAGDELGVLEQPSGRRTQGQAHDHAAERAGERGADGTCAGQATARRLTA